MKSACEHRAQMALELFEGEIMNIPHSLTPDGVSLYHGNKADIAKRLNSEELLLFFAYFFNWITMANKKNKKNNSSTQKSC